jgi:nitroimidazol reductase NimA-like FMN-containing flavoprotein (pyridoxamine 5'-phosphate oxidase superfamily)
VTDPSVPRVIEELDRREIDELLGAQAVGRIGCHAEEAMYVVPVIHAYDGECLYIASVEGRKVRMMRESPEVCYEVDEYDGAGRWRSAIVWGTFEELDAAGSERALALLAERFRAPGGEAVERRRAETGRETVCFRIRIARATGRAVR